jgi:hypothetical protein
MKKKTIGQLKKLADTYYSRKLRSSSADHNGIVKCYTCDTYKYWKEMQCGHYITRSVSATRYDPHNTKPQCVGCNMFNEGRKDIFAINLVKEYGIEILEELNAKKNLPPLTRAEIESVINDNKM